MKRLLFLILTLAISSGAYRYHETAKATHDPPPIKPARPRTWTWVIPGWQPTISRQFERMNDGERIQARRNDRWAVRDIRTPPDAGRLIVSLFVRLGKGQHRPDSAGYWPAILDALEGVGIVAKPGDVRFDSVRGSDRDDVETTVELSEAR